MIVKNIDARFTISGGCELILAMPKSERESISHLIEEFVGREEFVRIFGRNWLG